MKGQECQIVLFVFRPNGVVARSPVLVFVHRAFVAVACGDRPLHFLVQPVAQKTMVFGPFLTNLPSGPVYVSGGPGTTQISSRHRPSLTSAQQTVAAPTTGGTATAVGAVTVVASLLHVVDPDDGLYRFIFKGTGDVTNGAGQATVILTFTLPANVKLSASAVIAGSGLITGSTENFHLAYDFARTGASTFTVTFRNIMPADGSVLATIIASTYCLDLLIKV